MCQLDDSRHKGGGRGVDDILNVVDGGLVVQVKTELVLNFLHTFVGLEKEWTSGKQKSKEQVKWILLITGLQIYEFFLQISVAFKGS